MLCMHGAAELGSLGGYGRWSIRPYQAPVLHITHSHRRGVRCRRAPIERERTRLAFYDADRRRLEGRLHVAAKYDI